MFLSYNNKQIIYRIGHSITYLVQPEKAFIAIGDLIKVKSGLHQLIYNKGESCQTEMKHYC